MKKFIITLIAGAAIAANVAAFEIGIIDPQIVFEKYPETKKTQQYLESKKIELQKVLNEEKDIISKKEEEVSAKAEKATDKEKKELEAMKENFKEKFKALQQRLDQDQYTMLDKIKTDIKMGIEEVSKNKKLDLVIDSSAVYYVKSGLNIDITEDVLKFLSTSESISLED